MSLFPSIQNVDIGSLLASSQATTQRANVNRTNARVAGEGQKLAAQTAANAQATTERIANKRIALETAKQIQDQVDATLERELKKQGLNIRREDLAASREDRKFAREQQQAGLKIQRDRLGQSIAASRGEIFDPDGTTVSPSVSPSVSPITDSSVGEKSRREELEAPFLAKKEINRKKLANHKLDFRNRQSIEGEQTELDIALTKIPEQMVKEERGRLALEEQKKSKSQIAREALNQTFTTTGRVTDHLGTVSVLSKFDDLTGDEKSRLNTSKSFLKKDAIIFKNGILEKKKLPLVNNRPTAPEISSESDLIEIGLAAIQRAKASGLSNEIISRQFEKPITDKLLKDIDSSPSSFEEVQIFFDKVNEINNIKRLTGNDFNIPNLGEIATNRRDIFKPGDKMIPGEKIRIVFLNRKQSFKQGTEEEFNQARKEFESLFQEK